jgi:hypothetical protein
MTKVNIHFVSWYRIENNLFEFYSADVNCGKKPICGCTGFNDLTKFVKDVLFEFEYFKLKDPEVIISSRPEFNNLPKGIREEREIDEETKNTLINLFKNSELISEAKKDYEYFKTNPPKINYVPLTYFLPQLN